MDSSHPLTALTRSQNRGSTERHRLNQLLDSVQTGVLSTVYEGLPWSMPIFFARDGDRILFHGSTGAGALRHIAAGAPVNFTVFSLDGFVVAYSAFESSANYRSAVIRGKAQAVAGEEIPAVLDVIIDRLLPGRRAEVPENTRKEVAATLCLELPIVEGGWLFKFRDEDSTPPDDDRAIDYWTGLVPCRLVMDEPVKDEWNVSSALVPPSVHLLRQEL